ncbi:MAG TPA: helix-turn-helix transcriptional regulator [Bacteroidales bacterium]|nr:helix-turn-helix transcriptional regulator [Bacteroidales bacterium]
MISFSENLKRVRTQKGISQEELSKKIDIHPVQFSRYERAQSVPSIDVVQKIANALEVTIDELVYGNQNNKAEQNIKDRELLSMFSKIQLLNEKQKETVKDFLSAYILKVDLKEKLIV